MKRIVVLERISSAPTEQRYRYLIWAQVPVARRPFYAHAGLTSAWSGASAAENTALADGSVVERVETIIVPSGLTMLQIEGLLDAAATAYQAEINADNRWARYGSYYDPDNGGWTAGGVA